MRKQPVTRRQFLGSGIAAAGAISISSALPANGALPANARGWEEYSARFDRSISDGLPAGPLRPDDEAAWKAVAKNYDVTNKITNLENGYWGIMANPVLAEYKQLTEFINNENTIFAQLRWSETYRGVRNTVAGFLNVSEFAPYLFRDSKLELAKSFYFNSLILDWCRRGDSNPHELPHTPLKRARLPVPPLRHEVSLEGGYYSRKSFNQRTLLARSR